MDEVGYRDMFMFYYVYQTTNLVNGRIYIGVHSTTDISDGYLGSGKALLRAINKYGKDKFSKEILSFYDSAEEAYEEESYIVNEDWIADRTTYNIVVGGRGGSPPSRKGKEVSLESRKKRSESMKRRLAIKAGLEVEKIQDVVSKKGRRVLDTSTGNVYISIKEASKALNISYSTLHDRLRIGNPNYKFII